MPDAPLGFQCRSASASVRESPSAHAPIGDASDFTMQCNSRAKGACLVKIRCHFASVVSVLQHFAPGYYRAPCKGFFKESEWVARLESNVGLAIPAAKLKNPRF